jgi:hypothetical protein
MKLPSPPGRYDQALEAQRNLLLEQADKQNRKRLEDFEVAEPQRLILRSPDGTQWKLVVSNAGVLTATTL